MLDYIPRPSPTPAGVPPLWLVSHGDAVVGPVSTTRLVRGVRYGRIPDKALVRERAWSEWRHIERIREVAALRREQARHGEVAVPRARFHPASAATPFQSERLRRQLASARDPGEVLLFALAEIMRVTDARVGVVHRARAPHVGLVTSSASGPGMHTRLGHVVPGDDPSLKEAALGHTFACEAGVGAIGKRIAERLGRVPAAAGVAMAPVVIASRVYAVVEVGRADHGFRRADLTQLRLVIDTAAERLGRVRNPTQH